MKRFLAILLCLAVLLTGCGKKGDVVLDEGYVIVCAEEGGSVREAALSLQVALEQKCNLSLEVVTETPEGAKTITVAVEEALEEGQYRTRIADGNVFIEAGSSDAMVFAMREIRRSWLGESEEPVLKAETLDALCGKVEFANAPFLVLTQNIRYADDEGGNTVIDRAPRFNKLVTEYQPDLIFLQEDNKRWSMICDKFFGDMYGMAGTFSDGPEGTKGNRQSIYYRSDRYALLESGCFWLSETPDEPFSKLEASKSCRHCTWAVLKDSFTGREIFLCNTHLDNSTPEVRQFQLQVILDRLGDYMEKYPTVFCGDFNATPEEPTYATITERFSDPHVTAEKKLSDIDITCDKYGTWETPKRIDYMFCNDALTANSYRVMTDLYNGYISDHYGVTTQYSFAP